MSFFSKIKDPGLKKSLVEVEAAFLKAQRVISNTEEAVNATSKAIRRLPSHTLGGGAEEDARDQLEILGKRLDAAKEKLPAELMAVARRVKIEYKIDWSKVQLRH